MRCHATFNGFRCDQDMSEHNPDEHSYWVRWDDDGEPLVDMPLLLPISASAREMVAVEQEDGQPEPGQAATERGWVLSPQGGIRYDEPVADRCGICGHVWHTAPCNRQIQAGEYQTECGCETASP